MLRFLVPLCLLLVSCDKTSDYKKIIGSTMGTNYSIVFKNNQSDLSALHRSIEQELAEINQLMSTYIADSEINQFNQLTDDSCFEFSDKSWHVLLAAKQIYSETNGAFDITLGPLISRWGFSAEDYSNKVPSQQEVTSLLTKVGTDKLDFNLSEQCISKKHSGITINLSAIAKGYAVDRLASILKQHQISYYLVDIGGEVTARGLNANGKNWQIAIEKPSPIANARQQSVVVTLSNTSIATSGDYRNYFEVDGKRFSHTIDPNNGYPVQHQLSSISVIHKSNMLADAYATAFNVMGEQASYLLADKLGLPVYSISRKNDQLVVKSNHQFKRYISQP